MCWSGEASTVLATIGLSSTAFFYYKKEPPVLCLTLGYFALMEALQAYTYTVIDQCGDPGNQIATLLGYLHIAFQPFFINAISLYFIPERIKIRISGAVYAFCFISTLCLLIRIYPFNWIPACYQVKYKLFLLDSFFDPFIVPFCGERICSISGQWHIAWEIPAIANLASINMYCIAAFVLPFLYGSWKMTAYHLFTGPFLAYLTTNNPNEWAAVWCLYSIGLLLLLVKTPIRRYLRVGHWFWWRFLEKPGEDIRRNIP